MTSPREMALQAQAESSSPSRWQRGVGKFDVGEVTRAGGTQQRRELIEGRLHARDAVVAVSVRSRKRSIRPDLAPRPSLLTAGCRCSSHDAGHRAYRSRWWHRGQGGFEPVVQVGPVGKDRVLYPSHAASKTIAPRQTKTASSSYRPLFLPHLHLTSTLAIDDYPPAGIDPLVIERKKNGSQKSHVRLSQALVLAHRPVEHDVLVGRLYLAGRVFERRPVDHALVVGVRIARGRKACPVPADGPEEREIVRVEDVGGEGGP